MAFLKKVYPFIIGFVLVSSFPYIGVNLLDYYYGTNPKFEPNNLMDIQTQVDISKVFYLASFLFLAAFFISLYNFIKKKKAWLSTKTKFFVSLAIPIFMYTWLIFQILDRQNLQIGFFLTIHRDDYIHFQRLIGLGAKPDEFVKLPNSKENSHLILAVGLNRKEMVRDMISLGVNKNYKNKEGKTALDFAISKNNQDLIKMLSE